MAEKLWRIEKDYLLSSCPWYVKIQILIVIICSTTKKVRDSNNFVMI